MKWKPKPGKIILRLIITALVLLPLAGSAVDTGTPDARIRSVSRPWEFDYVSWTASAVWAKLKTGALGAGRYLSAADGSELVQEYLKLRNEIVHLERDYAEILADPAFQEPSPDAEAVRRQLETKRTQRNQLQGIVEGVIQRQVETALADLGLTWGGKPFPPVLYHSEPNAYALIVSPRDEIRQEANLMLVPEMNLDQRMALEERIEEELNYSALVVGVGGVGLYPAMIIETGNLNWLYHVIGHEWTHNFLTIRPLGVNYFTSPELQTINETVADLSGEEIQRAVLARYYPEKLPEEDADSPPAPAPENGVSERSIRERQEEVLGDGRFDFRFEMHITRVVVDRLLAEDKVREAESYLEERREFFWDNGYPIRKLNQAYFAFYGSYAAQPGGAAGEQGVDLGEQLRALKRDLDSYSGFMKEVAWKWRLDQFQKTFAEHDLG